MTTFQVKLTDEALNDLLRIVEYIESELLKVIQNVLKNYRQQTPDFKMSGVCCLYVSLSL